MTPKMSCTSSAVSNRRLDVGPCGSRHVTSCLAVVVILLLPLTVSCRGALRQDLRLSVVGEGLFDAGILTEGQIVRHSFVLNNPTERTIKIERVDAACDCTAAFPSSRDVSPSGLVNIDVELNSAGLGGPVERDVVVVYVQDDREERVKLLVRGDVRSELELSERFIDFGTTPRGTVAERSVVVSPRSSDASEGEPIDVLSVASSNPHVAVSLHGGQAGKYTVRLRILPTGQPGWYYGNIVIMTSSRFMPEIRLPVRGIVA